MPYIPEDIIDEIRNRVDIVDVIGSHVPLKRQGSDFWGCCPFHKEKTASFKVSPERQSYYCFGCKKSGSVFRFLQEVENIGFVDAVHMLAHRVGVVIPERRSRDGRDQAQRRDERERHEALLSGVAQWYQNCLFSPNGAAGLRYLGERGIDEETIRKFGIGFAPDSFDACIGWALQNGFSRDDLVKTGMATFKSENPAKIYDRFRGRIMFSIHNHLGRVIGFSGRVLQKDSKKAKYVNSPETDLFKKNRTLYGFHLARQSFREAGSALICEGQIDVIACHRAGLTQAVSAQGTAFTEEHAKLLSRSTDKIILAFDADEAGRKAALRSIDVAHQAGLSVGVIALPPGDDPDSLFQREGADGLRRLFGEVKDAIPFAFEEACKKYPSRTPEEVNSIVQETVSLIASIPATVTRIEHCRWLARALSLPEEPIRETLEWFLKRRAQQEQRRPFPRREETRGAPPTFQPPSPNNPPPQNPPVSDSPADAFDFLPPDDAFDFVPPEEVSGFGPPLPVSSTVVRESPEFCALLDMSLVCESAARMVLEGLSPEVIPETPVGRALNLVLAYVEQGEWGEVFTEIRRDEELMACPEIGRIFASSAFVGFNPEQKTEGKVKRNKAVEAKLGKAIRDCLARISIDELEAKIQENQRSLATETDKGKLADLLREQTELVRRKNEFRFGKGG